MRAELRYPVQGDGDHDQQQAAAAFELEVALEMAIRDATADRTLRLEHYALAASADRDPNADKKKSHRSMTRDNSRRCPGYFFWCPESKMPDTAREIVETPTSPSRCAGPSLVWDF